MRSSFIEINVLIHKDIPNYIRPLDKDIEQVFDPKRNKAFPAWGMYPLDPAFRRRRKTGQDCRFCK